jgi:hypothetical protein
MTSTLSSRASARPRPPAATLVGWLQLVAAVGTALLAIGHAGVQVPLLSALGPGGDRAVPAAAIAFAVATVLFLAVATGAFTQARWSWPLGLAVNALAVLAGLANYRGPASAVGIAIGLAVLTLLLAPGGRHALLRRAR